ncbi:MAG: 16S rRNA (cytosine(1402)-N(4))-methyltransferase RsmH, partial [Bdellovibrionaceae bacterium]|nr:16S rRNA (cytosine(1402)-N(4))-methyltransferase RsmH [Pseudobdellovibrionaceae bacterium]
MIHIPVLLNEIKAHFELFRSYPNPIYFDGTFGRGGHYRELKKMIPQMKAVVFDQDPEAIKYAHQEFSNEITSEELVIFHDNFANFEKHYQGPIDFALLDLGVSSPQLDEAYRGFSFYHQGPLDMRMNNSSGTTAADIVNNYSEKELADLFISLGEVRNPFRVVRAIIHDRDKTPFVNTKDLSGMIERVDGWRRKGFHPATQYFMALRLAVNNELQVVEQVLPQLMKRINSGG